MLQSTLFSHMVGGAETGSTSGTREALGGRRGDLQTVGALWGRRGVDQPSRTAQTGSPPDTGTGRSTGGGRGRSGSPAGEKAGVPLSLGGQSDKSTVGTHPL